MVMEIAETFSSNLRMNHIPLAKFKGIQLHSLCISSNSSPRQYAHLIAVFEAETRKLSSLSWLSVLLLIPLPHCGDMIAEMLTGLLTS